MAALDPGVLGDESAIVPLPAPAEQPPGDEAPPSAELALTLELPEDVGDLTGVDYLAHYAMALAHCLAEGGSPPLRLELRASPRATGGDGHLRGLGLQVRAHAPRLDQAGLEALARIAASGCRIMSPAARGLDVRLDAELAETPAPAEADQPIGSELLLQVVREELAFLRRELDRRTEEALRKDRLIASLTERLPLPPPAQSLPSTPLDGGNRRSWWDALRRTLGRSAGARQNP
ncbi:MAG TPA: hypothetical protein VFA49_14795 [Chloroflexota bacterium]|nr:hypothetical protein [Chloroflexota bacterium]